MPGGTIACAEERYKQREKAHVSTCVCELTHTQVCAKPGTAHPTDMLAILEDALANSLLSSKCFCCPCCCGCCFAEERRCSSDRTSSTAVLLDLLLLLLRHRTGLLLLQRPRGTAACAGDKLKHAEQETCK